MDYREIQRIRLERKGVRLIFVMIGASIAGLWAIYSFVRLLLEYHVATAQEAAFRVSDLTLGYTIYIVTTIVSFIFSLLTRELVNNKHFYIRTGLIVGALFLGMLSMLHINLLSTAVMARYSEDQPVIDMSYSSDMTQLVEKTPALFYTFMVGVALMITSAIISILHRRKRNRYHRGQDFYV